MSDLPTLTDEDRAFIGRVMSGEHDNDLVRRGDVLEMIRSLRTTGVSLKNPHTYQKALTEVSKAVTGLEARGSVLRRGCYGSNGE